MLPSLSKVDLFIFLFYLFRTDYIITVCCLCCCSVDSVGSDQDGVPSKVSDSGVGGLESGEDSWISDTEVS